MLLFRRRAYFIIVGALCLFYAPIEIACLYLNHNPATASFMGLIYATNWREVIGIISAVWPLLIGLISIWTIYFILALRQPNDWMIPRKMGLRVFCIGISSLLVTAMCIFYRYSRNIYNIRDTKESILFAKDLTLMKFNKIFPYNIYISTQQILIEHQEMKRAQKSLKSFQFGVNSLHDSTPEIYILVIGEAARSGNFSINGYHRTTNPHLEERRNLVTYPHMYAQAGTTELSVPHMISRISILRHNDFYIEKTLPEAFQEAGFMTSWMTNKSRASYLQRVLDAADRCFETGKDMSTINNYDILLLTPLQEVLNQNANKQFVVLHTMGSHWKYDTRYTPEFEKFTPSIGKDFRLSMIAPNNKKQLINAYDNTILYTDYFMDSLISIVERQKISALVIYMSDHGENLYDDDRKLVLHGNYSASRWLFHVPFIIWYSDEYAALYPDKIKQLYAHTDTHDNSSLLFHSIIDAAGLYYINDTTSNVTLRTRSIFSEEYCAPDTLYVLTTEGDCVVLEEAD